MKRSLFPSLLCLFLIISCKNKKNENDSLQIHDGKENYESAPSNNNQNITSPTSTGKSRDVAGEGNNNANVDPNGEEKETGEDTRTTKVSEGNYIKDGETDGNCSCFCVDLTFNGTTELCLKEEAIFITARMSRGERGLVNIYLVEPASRNTEGKDIPWEEFDTNVPIATISKNENGNMELDWLGFTINGDLAMDYAIWGKKTLEGTYKKK